jgi:hypothetical protein
VTNGLNTRLLASHDGSILDGSNFGAEQLENLISAASSIATKDLRKAIETLLGQRGNLWVDAIRSATTNTISDMCGTWDDYLQPFVRSFLIPREATQEALSQLRSEPGRRVVIIEGAPLAGKSSVIREMSELANNSNDLCLLLVEADSTSEGVFQRLANKFSTELGWPATSADIRFWLRGVSARETGPKFVIAIDGNRVTSDQVRSDIDELVSDQYGRQLRILLALDETQTKSVILNETGRKKTKVGRSSVVVPVDVLNDAEFTLACEALNKVGMRFIPGAEAAGEYRTPWILRAIAADAGMPPDYDESLVTVLPPLMGLSLIANARSRFSDHDDLRSGYQKLAKCILKDAEDKDRPVHLALEAMTTYVVRKKKVNDKFSYEEFRALRESGAVKQTRHLSGEDVVIARLPESMAGELAEVLAKRLVKQLNSGVDSAAKWLLKISTSLPMGDVVAAQAIIDASRILEGLPLGFLSELLNDHPRKEALRAGLKASLYWPGVGEVGLQVNEDGSVVASCHGQIPMKLDLPPQQWDEMSMQVGGQGWLVLSHLASFQLLAIGNDGQLVDGARAALLIEIGSCPMPLRRPSVLKDNHGLWTHDIPEQGEVVCHRSGIVEPITLALLNTIVEMDIKEADNWIAQVMRRDSFPLLARIDIALRQVAQFADSEKAKWANQTLEGTIKPACARIFDLAHEH